MVQFVIKLKTNKVTSAKYIPGSPFSPFCPGKPFRPETPGTPAFPSCTRQISWQRLKDNSTATQTTPNRCTDSCILNNLKSHGE